MCNGFTFCSEIATISNFVAVSLPCDDHLEYFFCHFNCDFAFLGFYNVAGCCSSISSILKSTVSNPPCISQIKAHPGTAPT